jgi:hypothetical protein
MISRISLAVGTSGLLSLFEGVIVADRKVSHSEGRKEGRKAFLCNIHIHQPLTSYLLDTRYQVPEIFSSMHPSRDLPVKRTVEVTAAYTQIRNGRFREKERLKNAWIYCRIRYNTKQAVRPCRLRPQSSGLPIR